MIGNRTTEQLSEADLMVSAFDSDLAVLAQVAPPDFDDDPVNLRPVKLARLHVRAVDLDYQLPQISKVHPLFPALTQQVQLPVLCLSVNHKHRLAMQRQHAPGELVCKAP